MLRILIEIVEVMHPHCSIFLLNFSRLQSAIVLPIHTLLGDENILRVSRQIINCRFRRMNESEFEKLLQK